MDIVEEFSKFYKSIEKHGDKDKIELHPLKGKIALLTPPPLSLPYSDTDSAFRNMPGVVVLNFAKFSGSTIPKYGLEALNKIVTKDTAAEDTKVQLMLMVHVTKLNVPEPEVIFKHIENATCNVDVTAPMVSWIDIAYKVVQHFEVKKVTKEMMKQTFGHEYTKRIGGTHEENVTVKFVDMDEIALRGFAGINAVYLNKRHFIMKAYELSLHTVGTVAEKNNVMLIDIATVCLHELSHVKIRQVFNDLNFSTPNVLVNSSTNDEHEFGRIVENRFFGAIVNWKESFKRGNIPPKYVQDFIDALSANSALPLLPAGTDLIHRNSRTICKLVVEALIYFTRELSKSNSVVCGRL